VVGKLSPLQEIRQIQAANRRLSREITERLEIIDYQRYDGERQTKQLMQPEHLDIKSHSSKSGRKRPKGKITPDVYLDAVK
jgi:hypothetical protein